MATSGTPLLVNTTRELLTRVKTVIREIEPDKVKMRPSEVPLLDVPRPDAYEQGALPSTAHLPRGNLESQMGGRPRDKSQPVVLYYAGRDHSAFATKTLTDLGYADLASMISGFNKWKDDERPKKKRATLTSEQRNCYQHHLPLSKVEEADQIQLLGTAGFGSPTPLHLATARVGTFDIIDMDPIDASNP